MIFASILALLPLVTAEKFLVSFKKSGSSRSHHRAIHSVDPSLKILDTIQVNNFHAYVVSGDSESLDQIAARDDVLKVYPNKPLKIKAEAKFAPWGLLRISNRNVTTRGSYFYPDEAGEGVNVYVVDTGVFKEHPEFEGRVKWGISTVENGSHTDGHGHGTHVAGTIASQRYGVAKKANIISVRVFDSVGDGDTVALLAGLQWVMQDVAKSGKPSVINMSLGGEVDEALDDVSSELVDAGVYVVVAAGNEHMDACDCSPAGARGVFTVGATDLRDKRAYFSNYGECVDIWAPGVLISSTSNKGGSTFKDGTSMAAPHVAGVVALALSQNKNRFKTVQEGIEFIKQASSKNRVHGIRGAFGGLIYNDVFAEIESTPPAFTPVVCPINDCRSYCDVCE